MPNFERSEFLIAQNFDANQSAPSQRLTVPGAMRENANGGISASLTWASPLVILIIIAVYLFARRRLN